tara:strand:+ start:1205 stop:1906 length:702 start_codon:yes stop_codon:yes gene_type:complete
MAIKITTPTNSGDSVEFGSGVTAIAAEVKGSEVSSGEGKIELKTTTGGVSTTQLSIAANGTTTLTQPLPVASGGTGATSLALGKVVQVVNVQTGAVASGSTTIAWDDTIPQNTEGTEYMTLAITPTSATSKLRIDVVCHVTVIAGGYKVVTALFQDSTADALAVGFGFADSSAGQVRTSPFTHYMTAGTTSETTFKVRAGAHAGGTTTFNGAAGARKYGGVMASSITITEYSA